MGRSSFSDVVTAMVGAVVLSVALAEGTVASPPLRANTAGGTSESRLVAVRVDTTLAPISEANARLVAVRADTTEAGIKSVVARLIPTRVDTIEAGITQANARLVAVRSDTMIAPIAQALSRMFPMFVDTSSFAAQLRIDVVGPARIRANHRTAFDLIIQNQGSGDALAIPLWISGVPVDALVETDFNLTPIPHDAGEPEWGMAPLSFIGPGGRYLALVLPRLPSGVLTRRVYLSVPAADSTFQLRASLTPPWLDEATFRNCLLDGGVIQDPACMGAQLSAIDAFLLSTPGIEAVNGIGMWARIGWRCDGASTLAAALVEAEQALDFMIQPVDQQGLVPPTCGETLRPRWQDVVNVAVVSSLDPNDKFGARGIGGPQALAGQQILPYSIRFENLINATAPAQRVLVTDALDVGTLDPSTVTIDEIAFGDIRVFPPAGVSSFATEVAYPARNVNVLVSASIDRFTGMLSWYFSSIDPATHNPPVDPLVGFLPPNHDPNEGEGSVLFTVRTRPALTTGTVIRNRATIVFDDNPPVVTPEWFNTLDNTPPASHVMPLGANSDSARFTVGWQITDGSTDSRDFSVFVAEDEGAFRLWRLNTVASGDTFAPRSGHFYSFYSLARDSSGNIEAAPGTADAQTLSRTGVDGVGPWRLALEGARPNPAIGKIQTRFSLPGWEPATLELMDIAGRRVLRRDVGALGPGPHVLSLASPRLRPGLYFLRLTQGDRALNARVVLIR